MPEAVIPTPRFDAAIDRLVRLSGGAAAWYVANHRNRCCNDVVRLERLRPGGRILNVGGRPYVFEFAAREAGLEVDTLDLDPGRNAQEIADLGVTVTRVDIEDPVSRAGLDLAPYDVICMAEIFEHMRRDLPATMRFVRDGMRPDALLYLTTPNHFYAPIFMRNLVEGRSGPSLVDQWGKLETIGHMGHVREYSELELREFFDFCGFAIEGFSVRNSNPVAIGGGGVLQVPVRALARLLATSFDRFGQEFVFVLRPRR